MVDDVEKLLSVLLIRLSEFFLEFWFEFVENKFLLVNKVGILFINGKESYWIEVISDFIDVFILCFDEERLCVFLSDYSYIMFWGMKDGSGRVLMYFDVDGV